MADNRRKVMPRKTARTPVLIPPRLARWAELVALAHQLRRAIDDAGDDGIIEGHWWDALNEEMRELLADLFAGMPLE